MQAVDLTRRAPRSPRVRLGGFVILPRMLDKGRATVNNKAGEYHFNCPLDQRFLDFVGIKAEPLKKQLAQGKGDGEMLAWIQANAKFKRSPIEIAAWSVLMEQRAPADWNPGSISAKCTPPPRPNARTWRPGLTCWTWMILSPSAARPDAEAGPTRIAQRVTLPPAFANSRRKKSPCRGRPPRPAGWRSRPR